MADKRIVGRKTHKQTVSNTIDVSWIELWIQQQFLISHIHTQKLLYNFFFREKPSPLPPSQRTSPTKMELPKQRPKLLKVGLDIVVAKNAAQLCKQIEEEDNQ